MVKTLKLAAIAEHFVALKALSPDDHEALSRSAEDVRQRKFATDDEVLATFDRYRRR
jgi:hypothetical protein